MSMRNLIIIILVIILLLLIFCGSKSYKDVTENWVGLTDVISRQQRLNYDNAILCNAAKHNVTFRDPCKTPMELANMVERVEKKTDRKDNIYTVESTDLPMSTMDSIDPGDPFNIPKVVSINSGVMLEKNKYSSKADTIRGDLPIRPVRSLWGNSTGADVQNLRVGAFNVFDVSNGAKIAELQKESVLSSGRGC